MISLNLIISCLIPALGVLAKSETNLAHPFHVTIAEANFNEETKKLEIALRIYNPGDLEDALGQRAGERVRLETTENVDDLILEYLEESFVVKPSEDETAELHWVGKEVTVKTTWLYFEVDLPDGPFEVSYTNRLLFEIEPEQANTVVFGRGKDRSSLRFTADEPTKTLKRPDPNPDDQ